MRTPALPPVGATITTGDNTFTVRRTEAVNAYGSTGYRVYFDLNGRRVYSPMSLTAWNRIVAAHGSV